MIAGRFEVLRVLGKGGMGVVVAARDRTLERNVAVKLMVDRAAREAAFVERFKREARMAGRLTSSHTVRVFDAGEDRGAPFIVMELLQGRDLDAVLEAETTLEPSRAVAFVLQACVALREAHAGGIVHRDLKPANLFVAKTEDQDEQVKVLDFGIAKVVLDSTTEGATLTQAEQVLGTPLYMSPEQRLGREVDARTDIWAVGVVLYQALAGEPPFAAPTRAALEVMVLTEEPRPLEELRHGLPRALVAVVNRCLRKKPEDRFASVVDLMSALAPFAMRSRLDSETADSLAEAETELGEHRPGVAPRVGSTPPTEDAAPRPPVSHRPVIPVGGSAPGPSPVSAPAETPIARSPGAGDQGRTLVGTGPAPTPREAETAGESSGEAERGVTETGLTTSSATSRRSKRISPVYATVLGVAAFATSVWMFTLSYARQSQTGVLLMVGLFSMGVTLFTAGALNAAGQLEGVEPKVKLGGAAAIFLSLFSAGLKFVHPDAPQDRWFDFSVVLYEGSRTNCPDVYGTATVALAAGPRTVDVQGCNAVFSRLPQTLIGRKVELGIQSQGFVLARDPSRSPVELTTDAAYLEVLKRPPAIPPAIPPSGVPVTAAPTATAAATGSPVQTEPTPKGAGGRAGAAVSNACWDASGLVICTCGTPGCTERKASR